MDETRYRNSVTVWLSVKEQSWVCRFVGLRRLGLEMWIRNLAYFEQDDSM
jgi:hypothetical protein